MRLEGFILNTPVHVFIDSGADQSFLNPQVATRLALAIDSSYSEAVMVATGPYFRTKGLATDVPVWLQGYAFRCNFHLLAVAGCDMVLGVDWLETLGFVGWNFLLKIMEFSVGGTNYRLVGTSNIPSTLSAVSRHGHSSLGDSVNVLQQLSSLSTSLGMAAPSPDPIQALLLQYDDLFLPPNALPPHRAIDHRIRLLPGTGHVNVRPYRYGHAQKAELEKASCRHVIGRNHTTYH